jgi:hypothetical protein
MVEYKVGVVLQGLTVSVVVTGLEDSSNLIRVMVVVSVAVYSEECIDVRVDREIVMVFSTRLVLSTRVRRVDVFVTMIRVGEAVDDATRVDFLVRVIRVSEVVGDETRVDVLVRVTRVCEMVEVARRVVVLIRVMRVSEAVDDARLVDRTVGETCKDTVEMVLATVVVDRK